MERTLHRQLKERFGQSIEVAVAGYRIDAIDAEGRLVEVQTGSLGPLKTKVARLLQLGHRVRIVKPVVVRKRIVRQKSAAGPRLSMRASPKRGSVLDVFDDLVGFARVLALDGVALDIVLVAIDELRVTRRRWPGYKVVDRVLCEVVEHRRIEGAAALWTLLPNPSALPVQFTTRDLADTVQRPLWVAQRIAYCLHHAGAAALVCKSGRYRVYAKPMQEANAASG